MPNYLSKPNWSDFRELRRHCANDSDLQALHPSLRKSYEHYWSACRAPFLAWKFANSLEIVAAERMRAKYKSGGKLAKFIKGRLTQLQGLNACPYCGLQKNVTTDHYLPKEHFPQFASLSRNLVPSCTDCQGSGAKGQWFPGYRYKQKPLREPRGRGPLNRLLHPYFDTFLRNRVLRIEFEPEELLSDINLFVTAKNRAHRRLVQFHIEKINLPREAGWAIRTYWTGLISRIQMNPTHATNLSVLKQFLKEEMSRSHGECKSLNSIEFVFYYSVHSAPKKLQFLLNIAKQPVPPPNNKSLPKGKRYR
ncbi:hypothetical protein [Massilia psychrophila]|uniref:hypothetical protein n=1 Tax=Massilia psychrophila TaxID=1603353 RepID=UPI00117E9D7E|nr:hypothetical protein [Massilia psychrophila]GGE83717.1 hypothetical protein GCM10008020_30740 [Massilia psychrophila]